MKKILVVWYNTYQYQESIVKAFNMLEDTHADKFTLQYFNKQAGVLKKTATKLGISYFANKYNQDVSNNLIKKCDEYKPNLILFINADYVEFINKDLMDYIDKEKIKTAVWFIDTFLNMKEKYSREYLEKFSYLYSFDYNDVEYIQKEYLFKNIQYLPLGSDSSVYRKQKYDKSKMIDICFVGNADEKRLAVLEKVAKWCNGKNKTMIIYGQIWKFRPLLQRIKHRRIIKTKYKNLYKHVINKHITPNEIAKVYAGSRICLNILREGSSANPRTFEIMSTGTMQIMEHNKNVSLLFEDGIHLVMYKDANELEQLLDYYLAHEEERERIAESGYEAVMRKYVMSKLVVQIVKDIG